MTRFSKSDVISLVRRAGVDRLTPTHCGLVGFSLRLRTDLQHSLGQLAHRSDVSSDSLGQAEVVRLQVVSGHHPLRYSSVKIRLLLLSLTGLLGGEGDARSRWSCCPAGSAYSWSGQTSRAASWCWQPRHTDIGRERACSQIFRNSSDGSDWSWSPLVTTTECSHLASEAHISGLRHGNLAVLARPGTATGLGVHSRHEVLDLLHI